MKINTPQLKRSFCASLFLLTLLSVASSALAQDHRGGDADGYIGVRLGRLSLENVDDDGSLMFGIYGGGFITPWLALEGSVDFQETDFYVTDDDWVIGYNYLDRETTAFQAGLKLMPVTVGPVRPFVTGGVGYYMSEYADHDRIHHYEDRIDEGGFYGGAGIEFFGWGSASRGFSLTWDNRWLFTEKERYRENHIQSDGWTSSLGCTFRF